MREKSIRTLGLELLLQKMLHREQEAGLALLKGLGHCLCRPAPPLTLQTPPPLSFNPCCFQNST